MLREAHEMTQIVAVIDIGTSAIRMLIAQIGAKSNIEYLENLQKPVRLGRDVFTNGRISNAGLRESLSILNNFKSVMNDFGVNKIQAIGTSAVREAANRENFIDQVYVRTGIDIEILDGPEESRLELIAVEHALGSDQDLNASNTLIVEVGAGSTELMILNQGQVEVTRKLSIGSVRLPEQAMTGKIDNIAIKKILKRYVKDVVSGSIHDYNFENINLFVALGGDMRFVAQQLSEKIDKLFTVIDAKVFLNFVNKISKMSPDEVVKEFGINYGHAETLVPALIIYSNFFKETKADKVFIPMLSIRDGILLEYAQMRSGYKRTDVSKQVINSAKHLAQKYYSNKAHSTIVASLAVKLFDLLKSEHGMGSRERLLLEVSAILHDIGTYISPSSHHKHSSYLVNAAEIFGLRKTDKDIVSNVTRYHRGSVPKANHVAYMSLPRNERAIVTKLSSILRIADALDNSHQQKIRDFTLSASRDTYTIWVSPEIGDISVERSSLKKKGEMFSDTFGYSLSLKQGTP